jgi:hypothetical protein
MYGAPLLCKIRKLFSTQNAGKCDIVLLHVPYTKLPDGFQLNLAFDGSGPEVSEQFHFYAHQSISTTTLHEARS